MNSLPLSWSSINNSFQSSKRINKWNLSWIAFQNISLNNFTNEINQFISGPSNVVLRGCNNEIKDKLEKTGFYSTQIGLEAQLSTDQNHFKKKSLRELIRRGKRNGKIRQMPYSLENRNKFKKFKKDCVHGNEPQLKNLFQLEFNSENFLFVFISKEGLWLGAVLLSKNSKIKIHTELLLRRKNAPSGIMEALIEYSFIEMKNNGYSYFSLGEVPFTYKKLNFSDPVSILSHKMGKLLNFSYNWKGLYNFKKKFNPIWNEVYICSSTKIGFKQILIILIYSNFHSLVLQKIIYNIKEILNIKKLFKKQNYCSELT